MNVYHSQSIKGSHTIRSVLLYLETGWKEITQASKNLLSSTDVSTEQLVDMLAREVVNSIQWDWIFGWVKK